MSWITDAVGFAELVEIVYLHSAFGGLVPDRMQAHELDNNPANYTDLSEADMLQVRGLLAAGDRGAAYLLLAEKTGNQAFLNTAQISTGSGPLVGGVAISVNADLQVSFQDIYPDISIDEFSKYILEQELEGFEKINHADGTVTYRPPTELQAYINANNAWLNVKGYPDPQVAALFPGNFFLAAHYLITGDVTKAWGYNNPDVLNMILKALASEAADIGVQFGITQQQAELIAAAGGSSYTTNVQDEQLSVYRDSNGKVIGVFRLGDGEWLDRDSGLGLATVAYDEANNPFNYSSSGGYVLGFLLAGIGSNEALTALLNISSVVVKEDDARTYVDDIRSLLGAGGEPSRAGDVRDLFIKATSVVAEVSFANKFGIRELVGVSPEQVALLALQDNDDGLAVRRALLELKPYAIVGADYSALSAQLELYDTQTGLGEITSEWITERSAILAAYNLYRRNGEADGVLSLPFGDPFLTFGDTIISDAALGDAQQLTIDGYDFGLLEPRYIRFGNQGTDTLLGADKDDRLYGMGGNDTLKGEGGKDYLEGGSGDDNLQGGGDNDTLLGMSGNDVLDGGTGNDILNGGKGDDRYEFHSGDGSDQIIDIDGQGSLWLDGVPLIGGKEAVAGAGTWKSADGKVTYALSTNPDQTQTLNIQYGNNLIRVRDFVLGQLGITLDDGDEAPPPTTDPTLVGDRKPIDVNPTEPGDQYDYDPLGNILTSDEVEVRKDSLFGGTGHDRIQGLADDDVLEGDLGNDTLEGGTGKDRLDGQADNDLLIGGEDSDILIGGEGDDQLYAEIQVSIETVRGQAEGSGLKGDWLAAGLGDDLLVGDIGNDVLFGGGGKDTLFGGAGDDVLVGDNDHVAVSFNWIVDDYGYTFRRYFWPVSGDENAIQLADSDFIYGGAGNDFLAGLDGNDWLFGEQGQDTLSGGAGDDQLFGGDDNDWLTGDYGQAVTEADSDFLLTSGNDTLDGGAGDDWMQGEAGDDLLIGGADNDTLSGDADYLDGAEHGNDQLEGGIGNDQLFGEGGNDALYGGEGNDEVVGDQIESKLAGQFHGKDTLYGGGGLDTLFGGGGDDELHGGSEDDNLVGDFELSQLAVNFHGNDRLYGDAGNDKLWGSGGNDTLYGGADNDQLQGDASDLTGADCGNDVLYGEVGQDTLAGGGGNDTLNGGADFDFLIGGAGDDTYIFNLGDGPHSPEGYTEFIQDSEGANTIEFGAGIKVDDVGIFLYPDGGVLLQYSHSDDVFMAGGLAGSVKTIKFADGSTYSLQSLFARNAQQVVDVSTATAGADLVGSAGANQLAATGGNSTFRGGRGDDTLVGAGGGNLYLYERGDGVDHIYDAGGYSLPDGTPLPNRVQFGAGIRQQDVRLAPGAGGTLEVLVAGDPSGKLIIHNFEANDAANSSALDYFEFADGTSLSYAALLGSGFQVVGGGGNDNLLGSNLADQLVGGSGNDTLSAGAGNDSLEGGVGNDLLNGGAGEDLYLYSKGQGTDTLVETADGSTNTLRFAAGLTAADIELAADASQNLVLRIINTSDSLVLTNWLAADSALVQRIEFADGTVWTPEWIRQNLRVQSGTSGNDLLTALPGQASTLYGLAGNDTLNGSTGDDQLVGGTGNDTLAGGAGNDNYLISLGDGQDRLTETAGMDAVEYLVGISSSDITVSRADSDLLLTHVNGTDKLTIKNWYAYTDGRNWVEEVRFADGSIWTAAQLTQQGLTLVGSDGNDDLRGIDNFGDTLLGGNGSDYLYSYSGDDHLDGGAGFDYLYGGDGNDTLTAGLDGANVNGGAGDDVYIYSVGDGPLTINESSGNDVLRFGPGVTQNDVQVSKYSDSLRLTLVGGGVVDIYNWFSSASGAELIERIEFADGTSWDAAAIQAQITAHVATEASDSLIGYSTNDYIRSWGGNDTVYGYAGNDTLDGGAGNDSLVGGEGDDVYFVDSALDLVIENANEGVDKVISSVSYTLSNDVENLTLTGSAAISGTGNGLSNMLVGNSAANTLTGGAGDDTLDGGLGNDTLVGGVGNDTYIIDTLSDVLVENASEGTDTVVSALSYTLASNFENLTLTGGAALSGTGNALDNVVTGNSGDNVLNGGAGIDTLVGGWGNDTYLVDSSADVIIESASAGLDLVQSTVSYTLSANVENLTLIGTGAINGTGNSLNNTLAGNSGANVLAGGLGDDTYVVAAGDTVIENVDEGIDTIQSALTYTLGNHLENLTLTGTSTVSGTGNGLNNIIIGNSAKNKLTGGAGDDRLEGGGGTDTLIGGTGNDYYVIDDSRDAITENANEGTDTVQAAFTYTLAANFENLTLATGLAINGTGNAVNNIITGNELGNILSGAAGADTLIGGNGNDTYIVENINDVVVENAGEGADLVQSSVTYTLSANVESLTLTGSLAINGFGNDLNNTLIGNTGANLLAGGAGDDIYVIAAGDSVVESADEGVDTVQSAVTYTLGSNLENLTLTGTSAINGTGNGLNNILTGNSGNNVLSGGAGDDIYVIGSGDTVIENVGGGTDTVQSSVTHTLSANVENITLIGSSNINATGNGLDNILIGNSGANVLAGGAGDDIYFVTSGDSVVEGLSSGTDTVHSAVTFTLAANIENLKLTGAAAINGTGNSGNNSLIGNVANNLLNGGAGDDTMSGGLGDDTYIIDSLGDVVIESAGEGTDTVQSTISYMSGGNVENITLLGTLAIDASGDETNNVLVGNSAANTLTGAGGDDTLNGGGGSDTLIGGVGDDTYILGMTGAVVIENASEGIDTVQTAETYSLEMNENLENLILTGATAINGTGNSSNNIITGNDGNNVLDGGVGTDTLYGGLGNDTLYGGSGDMLYGGAGDDLYILMGGGNVSESGGSGVDTIQTDSSRSLVDYSYWSNADSSIHYVGAIENATLTGSANATLQGHDGNNILTGNTGNNRIYSWRGNDTMDGGSGNDTLQGSKGTYLMIGGAGDDRLELFDGIGSATMRGGSGDDWYRVNNAYLSQATFTEYANEGIDTVDISGAAMSGSYTLGTNLENLIISRFDGIGNSLDNFMTSTGSEAIALYGMSGNDTLKGSLSTGIDTLIGGIGNDTYIVNAADIIIENANEGTDTVETSVTYTLGSNIENLTLTGTTSVNGTGNILNNSIIGNAASNVLSGGGGADTLSGGAGNDIYAVDSTDDVVVENVSAGTDLVQSSISYILGADVENLTLTGTTAINGTGNTLNNVIVGNAANNVLSGGGGADTLSGGAGNDTYVVDSTSDVVLESSNEGTDLVQSSISYTLGADVENLTLIGALSINGTGNQLDNVLAGNSGNNTLNGAGGSDTYLFGIGSGQDVISNNDTSAGSEDMLLFGDGISVEQLWFRQNGSNLDVSVIGSSEKATVSSWYSGSNYHLDQFKTADGKTLLDGQVQNLVDAMASFGVPPGGEGNLTPDQRTQLDAVIAANWQ